VVEGQVLPGDRVAVSSTVRVRDLDSAVAHDYTLVWPSHATPRNGAFRCWPRWGRRCSAVAPAIGSNGRCPADWCG
jgi:hypothetical protein